MDMSDNFDAPSSSAMVQPMDEAGAGTQRLAWLSDNVD